MLSLSEVDGVIHLFLRLTLVLGLARLASGEALAAAPPRASKPAARVDALGDPLPADAVARFGTTRFPSARERILFLPDGRTLACAREDVLLQDVATGKEVGRLPGIRGDFVTRLVCSPNGKQLAAGYYHGPLRIWDIASGRTLWEWRPAGLDPLGYRYDLAFSNDGRRLYGGGGGHLISCWDLRTGKPLAVPGGLPQSPPRLRFGPPAGGRVALLGQDGDLEIHDLDTGKKLVGLGRTGPVLAWSPDGKQLAAGPTKGAGQAETAVELFDARTGQRRYQLRVPRMGAQILSFSPDGKTLVTGGEAHLVSLWDTTTGRKTGHYRSSAQWHPRGHPTPWLRDVAFSPAGRPIGVFDLGPPTDLITEKELCPLPGHRGGIGRVAVFPDGKTACTAGDGTLRTWDLATGKEREVVGRGLGYARALAVSHDGRFLAFADDFQVRVWRRDNGRLRPAWSHEGQTLCVAFSSDGRHLFSGTVGLAQHEVATGRLLRRSQPHDRRGFYTVACSPEGKVATGGPDGKVRLWDGGVRLLRDLVPHRRRGGPGAEEACVNVLAFSPDGRSIYSASSDRSVRVWEVPTGEERARFDAGLAISSMVLSPDGQVVVFPFGAPGGLRYWRPRTGQSGGFDRPGLTSLAMAFSPDSHLLVTGGPPCTALVWDLRRLLPPPPPARRLSAAELARCWEALAGDAATAYRGLNEMLATPEQAVALVRDQLRPAQAITATGLARLVADLDADEFPRRERAFRQLEAQEELARPALERASQGKPSLELRKRVEALLRSLDQGAPGADLRRAIRAVELLEAAGTPAAGAVLKTLARGQPRARLTREAQGSLQRLQGR